MSTEPARYRKRPVEIEAMQLVDDLANHVAIANWIADGGGDVALPPLEPCLVIRTREGDMRADIGDWVIRGTKGEFYPCKPDIFADIYEPVTGTTWTHSCGRSVVRHDGAAPFKLCTSCGREDGVWSTTLKVVTS